MKCATPTCTWPAAPDNTLCAFCYEKLKRALRQAKCPDCLRAYNQCVCPPKVKVANG